MTDPELHLADFGWSSHFESQFGPEDRASSMPVRVMAVHRDRLAVAAPGIDRAIAPLPPDSADEEGAATVGDWLLVDLQTLRPRKLLQRRSLFRRRAAGADCRVQLIAANVDTLFVVSSCNQDFNPARIERYLALAREAQVTPVVVLTKADLAEDTGSYARKARDLLPGLLVETVDAREPSEVGVLKPWLARGQTVALVGSSGVGKSTLVNSLAGLQLATREIRSDDDKGRHTTTARSMHRMPAGGWLIDLPGMRELQLAGVEKGIGDVFSDIVRLSGRCRFADCAHETEPGCAVHEAIRSGALDEARMRRWRKLVAEEAHNTEAIFERRARERAFGKLARRVMRDKASRRGD